MKTKRLLVLVLAMVLCLGVFAGASAEKLTISIGSWDVVSGITSPETDLIYGALSDKFNVLFTPVNTTWDDYEQKIQVWAASDQLPDYFAIDAFGKPYYNTWIKEGIVKDLTDEIPKYPHLAKMMEGPDFAAYNTEGRNYCIPRAAYFDSRYFANEKAVMLRKDLMEAAGYSKDNQPKDLDEFIAMIQEMMRIGNCEVGITAFDRNFMCGLTAPFQPNIMTGGNDWLWDDGQWKTAILTERGRDAAVGLGKMYAAGILDRDIATLGEDEGNNKFCAGQAVGYSYGGYPSALMITEGLWKITQPDKPFNEYVTFWRPWPNPDGKRYYDQRISPWSETYFRGDISQEKLDTMLSIMDYLASEEGLRLYRLGIEGIDYTMDAAGEITVTAEGFLGEKYPIINDNGMQWLLTWDQDFQYENPNMPKELVEMASDQLHWWWDNAESDLVFTDVRMSFFNPHILDEYADIANMSDPLMRAYITGDKAGETWDAMVKEITEDGYADAVKRHSDAAIAAGISK